MVHVKRGAFEFGDARFNRGDCAQDVNRDGSVPRTLPEGVGNLSLEHRSLDSRWKTILSSVSLQWVNDTQASFLSKQLVVE